MGVRDLTKPKVYVTRQLFEKAVDLLKKHADIEIFEGEDNPVPQRNTIRKGEGSRWSTVSVNR